MDLSVCSTIVRDSVLIGTCATALLDLWAQLRLRLFGTPTPDYRMVGRWFGHMPSGRFRHRSIRATTPVRGELALGWIAHYLIGIGFATLLPAIWGTAWLQTPSLGPALYVGVGSVAAPFLLMQPGMGAGVMARHTPQPGRARLQSLGNHLMFGFALFVAAHLLQWINLL